MKNCPQRPALQGLTQGPGLLQLERGLVSAPSASGRPVPRRLGAAAQNEP